MMPLTVFPLAFLTGILFNLTPSCGSGTLLWTSTQKQSGMRRDSSGMKIPPS